MDRRPSINSSRTSITCSLIVACYAVTNEVEMVQLTEQLWPAGE